MMKFKNYGELLDACLTDIEKLEGKMALHRQSDHGNSIYCKLQREVDDLYAAARVMRRTMLELLTDIPEK